MCHKYEKWKFSQRVLHKSDIIKMRKYRWFDMTWNFKKNCTEAQFSDVHFNDQVINF